MFICFWQRGALQLFSFAFFCMYKIVALHCTGWAFLLSCLCNILYTMFDWNEKTARQRIHIVFGDCDPQERNGSRGTSPNTPVPNVVRSCQTWTRCRFTSWTASTEGTPSIPAAKIGSLSTTIWVFLCFCLHLFSYAVWILQRFMMIHSSWCQDWSTLFYAALGQWV